MWQRINTHRGVMRLTIFYPDIHNSDGISNISVQFANTSMRGLRNSDNMARPIYRCLYLGYQIPVTHIDNTTALTHETSRPVSE